MTESRSKILIFAWLSALFSLILLRLCFTFSDLAWAAMVLGAFAVYLTAYAIIKTIEEHGK